AQGASAATERVIEAEAEAVDVQAAPAVKALADLKRSSSNCRCCLADQFGRDLNQLKQHPVAHRDPISTECQFPAKCDNVSPTMYKSRHVRLLYVSCTREIRVVLSLATCSRVLAAASTLVTLFSLPVCAQQTEPVKPVVVQPGAPGKPTRDLPPTVRGKLPPISPADVQFMQGMI